MLNEEIKKMVEAPLGHVEVFSPEFESVAGISRSQGERKGKALAALEHFQELEVGSIPRRIQEVVQAGYKGPEA